MILTVTPNPSLDKTVELPAPLAVGQVQRAASQRAEPGGKGVNISRALTAAGERTLALLPGDPTDPVLTALSELGVPHRGLPVGEALRTNIAVTDPAGITTKINERGPQLDDAAMAGFQEMILRTVQGASWLALAGSLPPGAPADFYAQLITALRENSGLGQNDAGRSGSSTGADADTDASAQSPAPLVAVDASGEALAAAAAAGPDLIKPNAEELLELHAALCGTETSGTPRAAGVGTPSVTPEELEADHALVLRLVRDCQAHGVRAALVTLGAHGALLVPAPGSVPGSGETGPVLTASGPPLVVRSTVGAGDASLAGYLSAAARGADPEERLRHAMAQGRAAASLPGSTMPGPHDLRLGDVTVAEITPETKDTTS